MTLKQAIKLAEENGVYAVYRKPYPSRLRGIRTFFSEEDRRVRDWEVLLPNHENNEILIAAAPEMYEWLKKSKRFHYECEDTWYACPKSTTGCANNAEGDACNCGADEFNAQIDAIIAKAEGRQ